MASITQPSYNMFPRANGDEDFMLYPDPPTFTGYASPPVETRYSPDGYSYPQTPAFEGAPMYADTHQTHYMYNDGTPEMYTQDGELGVPSSTVSDSAASSAMGSPQSNAGQTAFAPEYHHDPLGVNPSIVPQGDYYTGSDYSFAAPGLEEFQHMPYDNKTSFVDPSLIHPEIRGPMGPPIQTYENPPNAFSPPNPYPNSPALSGHGSPASGMGPDGMSPYHMPYRYSPYTLPAQPIGRRPSVSYQSQASQEYPYSGDEAKEKQRCPHPDCGKVFKDLKAHMLTHQTERPEKCPIQTCDYHIKGFARKYDKNRHTLTHYKGNMVCGFCPGSGTAAEKSFNRADVFKRHLTAVHNVEQTPPNSRKKAAAASAANSGKKLTGYAPDATGKCSTCSATFSNAQDFYEHLDDCVLRIVQQEDPAESINAKRLAEVEKDKDVMDTLAKNQVPIGDDDDDDDMLDEEDAADTDYKQTGRSASKRKGNPPNGVQKSKAATHSRGGGGLSKPLKSRKSRHKEYPSSWGFDKGQMTMKKRVMAVFDGPRRLAKDELMLSTEHEVRVKIGDGNAYVTDLDVLSLQRAEGFHNATSEEKGTWMSDDPNAPDVRKMLETPGQG